MLSREQAQTLSRTIHLLRPAWNEEGIYAALSKCRDRDPFEVALAALRAAKDEKARTPGVIPGPGPHWNELAPAAPKVPPMSRDERRQRTCATCGVMQCDGRDHPFLPLDQAAKGRSEAVALARAELAQAVAGHCSHNLPPQFCTAHRDNEAATKPAPESATETEEQSA